MSQRFQMKVTYQITWIIVFHEKLTVPQPVKKFPASYETRRFITMFTQDPLLVLILCQINPVCAFPSPVCWIFLILSSHLRFRPSSLLLLPSLLSFFQQRVSQVSSYARSDQSFFLLYVWYSIPPWLCIVLPCFSHCRSNRSSPAFSSTMFKNLYGISDLLL